MKTWSRWTLVFTAPPKRQRLLTPALFKHFLFRPTFLIYLLLSPPLSSLCHSPPPSSPTASFLNHKASLKRFRWDLRTTKRRFCGQAEKQNMRFFFSSQILRLTFFLSTPAKLFFLTFPYGNVTDWNSSVAVSLSLQHCGITPAGWCQVKHLWQSH